MAVVQNPLIGAGGGSVGEVTMSTWKGRNVLKRKIFRSNQPNTASQLSQRELWKAATILSRKSTFILNKIMKPYADSLQITPNNAWMTINTKTGTGSYDRVFTAPYTPTVVPGDIVWSRGDQVNVINAAVTSTVANRLDFTWTNNTNLLNPRANANDSVFLVVIDSEYITNPTAPNTLPPEAVINAQFGAPIRSSAAHNFTLPTVYSGRTVHCYICTGQYGSGVNSGVIEHVSDSSYVGSILVA